MQKRNPRGFVILIVLAAVVVISVVVGGQLISGQKAEVTGLRVSEEVQARAIAQGCLEMMSAYAERQNPAPAPGDTLDVLLAGPDGVANTADDYLPFGGARQVAIPPGSGNALHQWNLVDIPGSGGVCAVRFDDNSDDARPPLPGANFDSAAEIAVQTAGTGNDIPNEDRDSSVYLTVIGLYPVLQGTTDPTAYARAHTRVTLRRLIQNVNVFQPLAPALWAGSTIDLQNNNDICGAGGIQAINVDMDNNSCSCGDVIATNLTGAGIPSAGDTCVCPGLCPPANLPALPPQDPPSNVHWANIGDVLANEGFGQPLEVDPTQAPPTGEGVVADPATANNIGDASVCSFFGATNGDLFVWDASTNDAQASLANLSAIPAATLAAAPYNVPAHNCQNFTSDPLPRPCTWDPNTPGSEISCAAGQSPCWKLIARLTGGTISEDVGLGTAGPGSARIEHTDTGSDEEWYPQRGGGTAFIPNVDGNFHFGPGASRLCGSATSCTSCPNDGSRPGGDDALEYDPGDDWEFDSTSMRRFMPAPSIFVLEGDVDIVDVGGADGPLNLTVLATGDVDIDGNASLCCARCDCSTLGTSIEPSSCRLNGTFGGSADSDVVDLYNTNIDVPPAGPPDERGRGYAVKAGGEVEIDGQLVVGDVRGGTVDLDEACMIGNIVGYGGAAPCASSSPCDPANVCFPNNGVVVGDVQSMTSIEAPNNVVIWGNVISKDSACFKNNAVVEGIVMAEDTIEFKNNATIVNTSTSGFGPQQDANAKIVTFMEASW